MTNELEPLKEYPFCPDGGDAHIFSGFLLPPYIECGKCGVILRGDNRIELRSKWNTRHKRTCKVDWRDKDWGVCECGGDVYAHDIHCSQCGREVSNRAEVVDGD